MMELLCALLLLTTNVHSFVADTTTTLFIDPSTFLNYQFGDNTEYESQFNYTKWSPHHALADESTRDSDLCKSVNTFASRWLNPDQNYFQLIPEDPNKSGYADLSWFNDSKNFDLILQGYPQYLKRYGNIDNADLIYCIGGVTWPSFMLNASDPNEVIPNNFDAATELITSSLNVIYQQTGHLPKYFEPMNEPNNKKDSDIKKMKYEQYAMNKVSNMFKSKGVMVGGPVQSEVAWMTTYNYDDSKNNNNMLWNETIGYLIKNDMNQTLQFISWHQFSAFKQKNNNQNEWKPNFYGSGCVHSTFDLIESYTNFINGKPTKILISEHGLNVEKEVETGDFNVTYMQYIGAQTHLTDILNFLDRPESQLKSNSFLLTSQNINSKFYPILIIYPQNNTLTPTSIVYNIWTLLKENNGNKVNSSIDFVNINNTETVKLHSYYNNNTNTLIVIIKEISWSDTNIDIVIKGIEGQSVDNIINYKALRVYWDMDKAEFIRIDVTLDSLNNIHLRGGETMVIYDIDYDINNKENIVNVYRKRYYLNNFEILNVDTNMS
eukprot:330344_1